MILEGFEIENWSCIKRVAVANLPPTGVIVLHGPNGTGKTSMIEALRACLMDNKSTSKALDRGFPKNSSEKPRVSVTFRANGTVWRITKQFNSKDSKLESQTSTGQWKLETVDPSESHERTRQLTGGSDSCLGLHQLLWLTQAEFHLPNSKEFDTDVQSRLRAVLGVLQTPLDDRFLGRVKQAWSRWFGARNKPGEKPKLKKDCPLDKALALLGQYQAELDAVETEFQTFERMMRESARLEVLSRDLQRQLEQKTTARDELQQQYERSLTRLESYRLAAERVATSENALTEALGKRQQRADAERDIRTAELSAQAAAREVEDKGSRLQVAERRLREVRQELQTSRNTGREWQDGLNEVRRRQRLLTQKDQVSTARENLQQAEEAARRLEELKQQARERPAPDAAMLRNLDDNRTHAGKLRADLEAAAIALALVPDPGATVARLTLDGAPEMAAEPPADGTPIRYSVRRRAEIAIPGWGRTELTRGSDARSLDQIEIDLAELDRQFAAALASFGVAAGDPAALHQLRTFAADKKVRDPELKRMQDEIKRLAPKGFDPLREQVAQLEMILHAGDSVAGSPMGSNDFPTTAADLEQLGDQLEGDLGRNASSVRALEQEIGEIEQGIEGAADTHAAVGTKIKAGTSTMAAPGLRRQEADAKSKLTTLEATAAVLREQLGRLLTAEQIDQAIQEAGIAVSQAQADLNSAKLSEDESTIGQRLDAAKESERALQARLTEVQREFHQTKGAISTTEGLHQKRAAAAARVEELIRQTEREALESEAYDCLYALFEECREKRLGAVMGPIHDRVLRWMRLLRIGNYEAVRFNDQFLPEKLVAGAGAIEMTLAEESTGTIEQIGLMVRLALGSTLSSPAEPVVAILDDPLTHSDVMRLDLMRAVLKNAAAGDAGATPPAGPLQIVVFTCHPEWFAIDGATIIDVAKAMA